MITQVKTACSLLAAAAALAASLLISTLAAAAWSANGAAVCTQASEQIHPVVVPSLNGSVIVVWFDSRNADQAIFAQRLDAAGNPMWAANGVLVGEIFSTSTDRPKALPDGAGGAYVVWSTTGLEINFERLIAQRINSSGTRLWGFGGGIVVCPANSHQNNPVMVSDFLPTAPPQVPGFIVAWEDNRSGDFEIYAQQVNRDGVRGWGDNGVRLSNSADPTFNPVICADGTNSMTLAGGAMVAWERSGATTDIFANRVDRAGAVIWGANGVAAGAASGDQFAPAIAGPAGAGTCFVAWSDGRNPLQTDIYAQRLVNGMPSWAANGLPVCNAAGDQNDPVIITSTVGASLAWEDGRDASDGDLFGQRIDNNGAGQWGANGLPVCDVDGNQFRARMVSDQQGGAFVTWVDQRGIDFDIFAQRMTVNGSRIFPVAGNPVCQAIDDQDEPELIFDGSFVIVTWEDFRPTGNNIDIYANQLQPGGVVLGTGTPEPAPTTDLRVRLLSSNPWSDEARLALDLPESARVEGNVYGMQGRWIRSLGGAELAAGTHELRWDGRNAAGMLEPAGVYFLRVDAGARSSVVKLVLAR
ncbi:MAG TPA: hypothetical protein VNM87_06040 [Candidatus Udaeobacter sp.]|nr:hypothetical protein [Candidatus Udaeobacter sp.]